MSLRDKRLKMKVLVSKGQRHMGQKRFKLRYEFWLEPDKPEHEQVMEAIERLKSDRAFAPVLRDGILVAEDLQRGSVEVLLEIYPWVANVIQGDQAAAKTIERLNTEIEALKGMLAYMAQQNPPVPSTEQGRAPLPPLAVEDDDAALLGIRKAESTGESAKNFLDSAFGLLG